MENGEELVGSEWRRSMNLLLARRWKASPAQMWCRQTRVSEHEMMETLLPGRLSAPPPPPMQLQCGL